jgi:hypothetical protein
MIGQSATTPDPALVLRAVADWPELPATPPDVAESRAAIAGACERIERELPDAARIHDVRGWLNAHADAADRLRAALVACLIAADHWNARIVCPRGATLSRGARGQYLRRRHEAVGRVFARVLARWAVLERIPISWIPRDAVRVALEERLRRAGFDAEVIDLRLVEPVLGGSEWVRRDCRFGLEAVRARVPDTAVPAVLHRAGRTEAAVVLSVEGTLMAYRPDGAAVHGAPLDEGGIIAAHAFDADFPPVPWYQLLARLIGLGVWIWNVVRRRRVRQGGRAVDPNR